MLTETEKYKLSVYSVKDVLHKTSDCKIELVQSSISSKLYVKRTYFGSNKKDIFCKIQSKNVRNIPTINEIFYDGTDTIIIEAYILGHTADTVNFSKKQLLKLISNICNSVADLHSINILHRDIKPLNIIVTSEYDAYLIDFGIARFYTEGIASDTTQLGTKGFAAPEQYGFQQTDFRSDIYSIGKTIEEIVKGSSISWDLKKLIAKATAFDPKNRFSSTRDLYNYALKSYYSIHIYVFATLLIVGAVALTYVNSRANTANKPTKLDTPDIATTEQTSTESTESTESTTEAITSENTTQITTVETTTQALTTKVEATTVITTNASANKEVSTQIATNYQSENINILNTKTDTNYLSSLFFTNEVDFMELLGDETQKSCRIKTNDTYMSVECIKNASKLTVNLSDEAGNAKALEVAFSEDMLNSCDFPDFHSFNAYIYFVDYDNNGDTDILVNFTDKTWDKMENGEYRYRVNKDSQGRPVPYILSNYSITKIIEHSKTKGFTICDGEIVYPENLYFKESVPNRFITFDGFNWFYVENGAIVAECL